MGFGRIVDQNSDEKRWVYSIDYVEQQIRIVTLMKKKKMGSGQIVDQNSDEKKMGVQYRLC